MIKFREVAQNRGVESPRPLPDERSFFRFWTDVTSINWADVNQDGKDDLFLGFHLQFRTPVDSPPLLYLNTGGRFTEIAAGFPPGTFPRTDRHVRTFFDADNDGDPDFVEISGGEGADGAFAGSPNQFFLNIDGASDFREVAAQFQLENTPARGRMATPIDVNMDGRLDLVQFNAVSRPSATTTDTIQLFINEGDRFVDATSNTILRSAENTIFGQVSDLDGDGSLELLVHGHRALQAIYRLTPSGPADVTDRFAPPTLSHATDVAVADFDGDLQPEVYVGRARTGSTADWVVVGRHDLALDLARIGSVDSHFTLGTTGAQGRLEIGIAIENDRLAVDEIFLGRSAVPLRADQLREHSSGCTGLSCVHDPSIVLQLDATDGAVEGLPPVGARMAVGLYVGYDPRTGNWDLVWNKAGDAVHLYARAIDGMAFTSVDPHDSPLRAGLPDQLLDLDQATGRFEDITHAAGLIGRSPTRAVVAGDFDNDMDVDLYLSLASPVRNLPNVVLENRGDGHFVERAIEGGGPGGGMGWTGYGSFDAVSAAAADFDHDGFLDIAIQNTALSTRAPFLGSSPIQLLRGVPNANHWLEVDLEGVMLDRDALGARVLVTAGDVVQMREQMLGIHLSSQDSQTLHFGLADHVTVETVEVVWRSGLHQTLTDIAADQVLRIREGIGTAADERFEATGDFDMAVVAGGGNDVILGGSGDDTLSGGSGRDRIGGGGGADGLAGGRAGDRLFGHRGDDLLSGGAGDDVLTGGLGDDLLEGGSGGDRLVFGSLEHGVDRIDDFAIEEGDVIDLRQIVDFNAGMPEQDIDDFVKFDDDGSDTTIQVDPDGPAGGSPFADLATIIDGLDGSVGDLVASGNLIV